MRRLIGYEFKKIISRKSTYLTVVIVFALLLLVYGANVFQQSWADEEGSTVTGLAAIAQSKAHAESLAGPVTGERLTGEFRTYKGFFASEDELKPEYGTDGSTREFINYENSHYFYFSTFLEPWMQGYQLPSSAIWSVDIDAPIDASEMMTRSLDKRLDRAMNDTWTYSDSERAFWHDKHQEVMVPLEYGYYGGWNAILDCFDFLVLILIGIAVGITPVFAGEYREKTDAVILATRYGKSKLMSAKVIASLLFAWAMAFGGLLVAIGIPLLCYGSQGADLPVQLVSLSIPYAMTLGQTVALSAGYIMLVATGLAAFVAFLSAKWRSTLGIMMVAIAVLFLPIFLPFLNNGVVVHASVLLPGLAFSFSNLFRVLISYPFGPVVFDAQFMIVVFYLVVIAVFIPLAMRAFRRHQVR